MLNKSNNPTAEQNTVDLHPQGNTRIKPTAELIGLHHQTLRRWWKAGKFPKPINVNGIPMFRNADLLAWLESHTANNIEGA